MNTLNDSLCDLYFIIPDKYETNKPGLNSLVTIDGILQHLWMEDYHITAFEA